MLSSSVVDLPALALQSGLRRKVIQLFSLSSGRLIAPPLIVRGSSTMRRSTIYAS
jgi:hypothetical protein